MARDIFGNPILRYGSSPIIPSAVRLTQSPAANPYDPRATFERDLQTELGVSPQAQRPMINPYLGRPSVARESAIARAGMTPAQKLALAQSSETARERAIRQSALGQQQQQQQQQQGGFFDGLPSPTSPAGQALGAFGSTALQLSGYQDRPITIGAGLGAAVQAAQKAYTEAEERQYKREQELAPQFKTVGNTLYRVENGQITGIIGGQKEAKIKGEAGRIKLPDGRITQAVYTEDGKMYEIGDMSKPIDPKEVTYIDQFTTQSVQQLETFFDNQIVPQEKTIKFIDRLADQIVKSPEGFVDRQKAKISSAIKRFAGSSDFTEEELNLALSQGTLTSLVGASRLEIFGPGVLTEAEAELARQIFVGDFENLTVQETLARLNSFREPAVQGYIRNLGRYNASRAAPVELEPFYEENPIFDWNAWEQGQVKTPNKSSTASTTAGGNTFVIN